MSSSYNLTDTLQATVDELRVRLTAAEVKLEVLIEERSFKKQVWARARRELGHLFLAIIIIAVASFFINTHTF